MLARRSFRLNPRVSPLAFQPSVTRSPLMAMKINVPMYQNLKIMTTRSFSSGMTQYQQQQQTMVQMSTDQKVSTVNSSKKEKVLETDNVKDQPTSRLKKLYQQSKELVVFYKDGLKLLWNNNKTAKALQQKIQQEGYSLNRSEFQLIHHNKIDMRKLIPFSIIFLILPESIPLFVMFAPGVVPSTCIKDSQIYKQREKLDKLRQTMSANVLRSAQYVKSISAEDFLSLTKFTKIAKHYDFDFDLDQIDRIHLASYCRFMGLNGWGTRGMLRKRLDRHFDYLKQDDKLISQEGVDSLTLRELQQAIEERGMRSLDLDQHHLRQGLKYWIATHSVEPPIARGLLVFSRMFLLNANYK